MRPNILKHCPAEYQGWVTVMMSPVGIPTVDFPITCNYVLIIKADIDRVMPVWQGYIWRPVSNEVMTGRAELDFIPCLHTPSTQNADESSDACSQLTVSVRNLKSVTTRYSPLFVKFCLGAENWITSRCVAKLHTRLVSFATARKKPQKLAFGTLERVWALTRLKCSDKAYWGEKHEVKLNSI